MKTLLISALVALAFTTGFTCSKNAPEATAPAETPAQEQLAAPAEGAAPAETAPAPEAAPAETK